MAIDINKQNMKQGLMGLVVALLEIIVETLRHQAVRRMEGGSLSDEEIEKLGTAFRDIFKVLEEMKKEHGIEESVRSARDSLDDIVSGMARDIDAAGVPMRSMGRRGE